MACYMFVFDVLSGKNKSEISRHFMIRSTTYPFRHRQPLELKSFRTKCAANEPINRSSRLFNELCDVYDPSLSRENVKRRLTDKLKSRQFFFVKHWHIPSHFDLEDLLWYPFLF
jgi:hypothetical protein